MQFVLTRLLFASLALLGEIAIANESHTSNVSDSAIKDNNIQLLHGIGNTLDSKSHFINSTNNRPIPILLVCLSNNFNPVEKLEISSTSSHRARAPPLTV